MKKKYLAFIFCLCFFNGFAQQLISSTPVVDKAFLLALRTLSNNTKDSLIKAGGDYGGEWVRDISINGWNAASLVSPGTTKFSMWSVTTDNHTLIGHQYWDRIIWAIAAYDYYLKNKDTVFLKQAYIASANTMVVQEREAYDSVYGLFTGPSVFNDGIAAYEEPVYSPEIKASGVVDFPGSKYIKCLSTNCVYFEAYNVLAKMAAHLGDSANRQMYLTKAQNLKKQIRNYLYDSKKGWLNYLIDQNGQVHPFQEGLGISFAILFDVINEPEARRVVAQMHIGKYGLPSIYPNFKRFSDEKPGRHNAMVWPFVNAFWLEACRKIGRNDIVEKEFLNLADLAVNKGNNDFYEIYNDLTGQPDGGWQSDRHWESVHDQTWSATGFLRMVFYGLLGMKFSEAGLSLSPDFPLVSKLGLKELDSLPYRGGIINIKISGKGETPKSILVNGRKVKRAFVKMDDKGVTTIEYRR